MVDASGISGQDDVDSREKAAQLLEVSVDATEDEISSAYQDAVLETHPDTGGSEELFKAVDRARDILEGEENVSDLAGRGGPPPGDRPDSGGAQARGSGGTDSDSGFGGVGAGSSARGAGGSQGFGKEASQEIVDAVETLLRQTTTEENLKEKYGESATIENVAEILATLIQAGGIDLGDVGKMLNDDFQFGTDMGDATGGLFGGNRSGSSVFGGGGAGGIFSSDPRDYMNTGGRGSSEEDDEDDDEDFGGA